MEPEDAPLVSICMPVFNGLQFLPQIFGVFAAQVFRNFEVIVVDDGSTDGSGDAARSLLRERGLSGRVIAIENRGPEQARDVACQSALGEIIAQADCDDRWDPAYLEAMTRVLTDHPDIDIVYCDQVDHFSDGRPSVLKSDVATWIDIQRARQHGDLYLFERGELFEMQLSGFVLLPSCTVYRRAVYHRAGPYEVSALPQRLALDWYFSLRATIGVRVAFLKRPMYLRYHHASNISRDFVEVIQCKTRIVRHMLSHEDLTRGQRQRVRAYAAALSKEVAYEFCSKRRQRWQGLRWVARTLCFQPRVDALKMGVLVLLPYTLVDAVRNGRHRRSRIDQ